VAARYVALTAAHRAAANEVVAAREPEMGTLTAARCGQPEAGGWKLTMLRKVIDAFL